jgi:hypothetical protein
MGKETSREDSWKNKIDPAFDKIIKFCIRFVECVGLCSNSGWVGLQEEALVLWEKKGMQGWIKSYDSSLRHNPS